MVQAARVCRIPTADGRLLRVIERVDLTSCESQAEAIGDRERWLEANGLSARPVTMAEEVRKAMWAQRSRRSK
jgi:hypothetical protein